MVVSVSFVYVLIACLLLFLSFGRVISLPYLAILGLFCLSYECFVKG